MAWFLYILRCADGSYYTGVAHDVAARVKRHNGGDGAQHTRERRPVRLVYVEQHQSLESARAREADVKGWGRRKKEALIRGERQPLDPSGLGANLAKRDSPG